MTRKLLFGVFAALFGFFVCACSKDPVADEIKTNYLQLKIDERVKTFSDVEGRWVDGGNFLEIIATDDGKEWFTFTVMSETTRVSAGNYTLDDESGFTILSTYSLVDDNGQLNYAGTRGTLAPEDAFSLRIDKIDNGSAEGSFTGVLVRVQGENTLGMVKITEGQFKTELKPN
ncbi:hypothetical protein H8B06_01910 [Sphingobacterium sp. DN00404]|uniref:Uncharacterized protein n=1 Tax=Sphingobacterium micropteri TaxID=2763501 RepID=A0ABR7YJX7_9SPHI|nr:hypothetical protein [Sphingobacterium micropteri]MBD1431566.1 hypothetical protein [Sphingobacterium micropteri]